MSSVLDNLRNLGNQTAGVVQNPQAEVQRRAQEAQAVRQSPLGQGINSMVRSERTDAEVNAATDYVSDGFTTQSDTIAKRNVWDVTADFFKGTYAGAAGVVAGGAKLFIGPDGAQAIDDHVARALDSRTDFLKTGIEAGAQRRQWFSEAIQSQVDQGNISQGRAELEKTWHHIKNMNAAEAEDLLQSTIGSLVPLIVTGANPYLAAAGLGLMGASTLAEVTDQIRDGLYDPENGPSHEELLESSERYQELYASHGSQVAARAQLYRELVNEGITDPAVLVATGIELFGVLAFARLGGLIKGKPRFTRKPGESRSAFNQRVRQAEIEARNVEAIARYGDDLAARRRNAVGNYLTDQAKGAGIEAVSEVLGSTTRNVRANVHMQDAGVIDPNESAWKGIGDEAYADFIGGAMSPAAVPVSVATQVAKNTLVGGARAAFTRKPRASEVDAVRNHVTASDDGQAREQTIGNINTNRVQETIAVEEGTPEQVSLRNAAASILAPNESNDPAKNQMLPQQGELPDSVPVDAKDKPVIHLVQELVEGVNDGSISTEDMPDVLRYIQRIQTEIGRIAEQASKEGDKQVYTDFTGILSVFDNDPSLNKAMETMRKAAENINLNLAPGAIPPTNYNRQLRDVLDFAPESITDEAAKDIAKNLEQMKISESFTEADRVKLQQSLATLLTVRKALKDSLAGLGEISEKLAKSLYEVRLNSGEKDGEFGPSLTQYAMRLSEAYENGDQSAIDSHLANLGGFYENQENKLAALQEHAKGKKKKVSYRSVQFNTGLTGEGEVTASSPNLIAAVEAEMAFIREIMDSIPKLHGKDSAAPKAPKGTKTKTKANKKEASRDVSGLLESTAGGTRNTGRLETALQLVESFIQHNPEQSVEGAKLLSEAEIDLTTDEGRRAAYNVLYAVNEALGGVAATREAAEVVRSGVSETGDTTNETQAIKDAVDALLTELQNVTNEPQAATKVENLLKRLRQFGYDNGGKLVRVKTASKGSGSTARGKRAGAIQVDAEGYILKADGSARKKFKTKDGKWVNRKATKAQLAARDKAVAERGQKTRWKREGIKSKGGLIVSEMLHRKKLETTPDNLKQQTALLEDIQQQLAQAQQGHNETLDANGNVLPVDAASNIIMQRGYPTIDEIRGNPGITFVIPIGGDKGYFQSLLRVNGSIPDNVKFVLTVADAANFTSSSRFTNETFTPEAMVQLVNQLFQVREDGSLPDQPVLPGMGNFLSRAEEQASSNLRRFMEAYRGAVQREAILGITGSAYRVMQAHIAAEAASQGTTVVQEEAQSTIEPTQEPTSTVEPQQQQQPEVVDQDDELNVELDVELGEVPVVSPDQSTQTINPQPLDLVFNDSVQDGVDPSTRRQVTTTIMSSPDWVKGPDRIKAILQSFVNGNIPTDGTVTGNDYLNRGAYSPNDLVYLALTSPNEAGSSRAEAARSWGSIKGHVEQAVIAGSSFVLNNRVDTSSPEFGELMDMFAKNNYVQGANGVWTVSEAPQQVMSPKTANALANKAKLTLTPKSSPADKIAAAASKALTALTNSYTEMFESFTSAKMASVSEAGKQDIANKLIDDLKTHAKELADQLQKLDSTITGDHLTDHINNLVEAVKQFEKDAAVDLGIFNPEMIAHHNGDLLYKAIHSAYASLAQYKGATVMASLEVIGNEQKRLQEFKKLWQQYGQDLELIKNIRGIHVTEAGVYWRDPVTQALYAVRPEDGSLDMLAARTQDNEPTIAEPVSYTYNPVVSAEQRNAVQAAQIEEFNGTTAHRSLRTGNRPTNLYEPRFIDSLRSKLVEMGHSGEAVTRILDAALEMASKSVDIDHLVRIFTDKGKFPIERRTLVRKFSDAKVKTTIATRRKQIKDALHATPEAAAVFNTVLGSSDVDALLAYFENNESVVVEEFVAEHMGRLSTQLNDPNVITDSVEGAEEALRNFARRMAVSQWLNTDIGRSYAFVAYDPATNTFSVPKKFQEAVAIAATTLLTDGASNLTGGNTVTLGDLASYFGYEDTQDAFLGPINSTRRVTVPAPKGEAIQPPTQGFYTLSEDQVGRDYSWPELRARRILHLDTATNSLARDVLTMLGYSRDGDIGEGYYMPAIRAALRNTVIGVGELGLNSNVSVMRMAPANYATIPSSGKNSPPHAAATIQGPFGPSEQLVITGVQAAATVLVGNFAGTQEDPSSTNRAGSKLLREVLPDSVPLYHVGDSGIPFTRRTGPTGQELLESQKTTLEYKANTPMYRDTAALDLFTGVGFDGVIEMFGHPGVENIALPMNRGDRAAKMGKNMSLQQGYSALEQITAEMEGSGLPMDILALYESARQIATGRLQNEGSANTQGNKLIRAGFSPHRQEVSVAAITDVIFNDGPLTPENAHAVVSVAQAFGMKVERQSIQQSLDQLRELINQDGFQEAIQSLYETAESRSRAPDFSQSVVFLKDALGGDFTERSAALMVELLRIKNHDGDTYRSTMHIEVDGVTNGPVLGGLMIGVNFNDPNWLNLVTRGGLSLGEDASLSTITENMGGRALADNYQAVATKAKQILQKRFDEWRQAAKGDIIASIAIASMETMMRSGLLEATMDDEGNVTITRTGTKDPVTVVFYGASPSAVSRSFVAGPYGVVINTLLGELATQAMRVPGNNAKLKNHEKWKGNYEQILTDVDFENLIRNNPTEFADVFFPGESDTQDIRSQKLIDFVKALGTLIQMEAAVEFADDGTSHVVTNPNYKYSGSSLGPTLSQYFTPETAEGANLGPHAFNQVAGALAPFLGDPIMTAIGEVAGSTKDAAGTLVNAIDGLGTALGAVYLKKVEELLATQEYDPAGGLTNNQLRAIERGLRDFGMSGQVANTIVTLVKQVATDGALGTIGYTHHDTSEQARRVPEPESSVAFGEVQGYTGKGSGISPTTIQSAGDARVLTEMYPALVQLAIEGIRDAFDGVEVNLTDVTAVQQVLNEAAAGSFAASPLTAIVEMFKQPNLLLEGLAPNDPVAQAAIAELNTDMPTLNREKLTGLDRALRNIRRLTQEANTNGSQGIYASLKAAREELKVTLESLKADVTRKHDDIVRQLTDRIGEDAAKMLALKMFQLSFAKPSMQDIQHFLDSNDSKLAKELQNYAPYRLFPEYINSFSKLASALTETEADYTSQATLYATLRNRHVELLPYPSVGSFLQSPLAQNTNPVSLEMVTTGSKNTSSVHDGSSIAIDPRSGYRVAVGSVALVQEMAREQSINNRAMQEVGFSLDQYAVMPDGRFVSESIDPAVRERFYEYMNSLPGGMPALHSDAYQTAASQFLAMRAAEIANEIREGQDVIAQGEITRAEQQGQISAEQAEALRTGRGLASRTQSSEMVNEQAKWSNNRLKEVSDQFKDAFKGSLAAPIVKYVVAEIKHMMANGSAVVVQSPEYNGQPYHYVDENGVSVIHIGSDTSLADIFHEMIHATLTTKINMYMDPKLRDRLTRNQRDGIFNMIEAWEKAKISPDRAMSARYDAFVRHAEEAGERAREQGLSREMQKANEVNEFITQALSYDELGVMMSNKDTPSTFKQLMSKVIRALRSILGISAEDMSAKNLLQSIQESFLGTLDIGIKREHRQSAVDRRKGSNVQSAPLYAPSIDGMMRDMPSWDTIPESIRNPYYEAMIRAINSGEFAAEQAEANFTDAVAAETSWAEAVNAGFTLPEGTREAYSQVEYMLNTGVKANPTVRAQLLEVGSKIARVLSIDALSNGAQVGTRAYYEAAEKFKFINSLKGPAKAVAMVTLAAFDKSFAKQVDQFTGVPSTQSREFTISNALGTVGEMAIGTNQSKILTARINNLVRSLAKKM